MMATAGLKWCAPLVLALGLALPAAQAAPGDILSNQDAAQLLNRMARAPQDVSYQGVYIHQFVDRMEAVRVVHIRDGSFEAERRESLDGSPREYLRQGDQVSLFLPENGQISLDRHHTSKLFPASCRISRSNCWPVIRYASSAVNAWPAWKPKSMISSRATNCVSCIASGSIRKVA